MTRLRFVSAVLFVAACQTPPLMADPDLPGSVLSGSVLAPYQDSYGPGVVLMTYGDNPMPPVGLGSPFSFTGISADAWRSAGPIAADSDDTDESSDRERYTSIAPFAFTGLEPGAYYLTAIIDQDRNFNPGISALGTPTCGDLEGWYQDDVALGTPAPIYVQPTSRLQNVPIGPLREITAPNPVFTVPGDRTLLPNSSFVIAAAGTGRIEFGKEVVIDLPGPSSDDPCAAGFSFTRRDADGDGKADGNSIIPIPGFEDRWPQVLLRWLGEPYDSDDDGILDAFDRKGEGDDVTIAALGYPSPPEGEAMPAPGETVLYRSLNVSFPGLGLRQAPGEDTKFLGYVNLPKGAWSVTLLALEGQIWTIPNELDHRMASSRALAAPGWTKGENTEQGVFMVIP